MIKKEEDYTEDEKKVAEVAKANKLEIIFFEDEPDKTITAQGLEGPEDLNILGTGKVMLLGEREYVGEMPIRDFDISLDGTKLYSRTTGKEILPEDMTDYQKSELRALTLFSGFPVKDDLGFSGSNFPPIRGF